MSSKLVVLLWRHCIFFEFSKWLPPPSWIFEIAKFYWLFGAERVETHQHTKLYQNRSIGCEDIKTFSIFQDGGRRHLDCQIHKILFADSVWTAQTHHSTKFHQNRSFLCGYIAILRIFKMAAIAILDFRNREILLAIVVERFRRISVTNFVKIGQSVAKILRFVNFLRWRPPPSWIFEIVNFYLLSVSGGPDASLYQISSKLVIPLQRYRDFSNFQDGRRRHLGFFKSRNFTGYWGTEGGDASACQILSKSVNRLRRY